MSVMTAVQFMFMLNYKNFSNRESVKCSSLTAHLWKNTVLQAQIYVMRFKSDLNYVRCQCRMVFLDCLVDELLSL